MNTELPNDEGLSNDARAVASQFHALTSMRFAMVENRPTHRYQTALDELVSAGLLSVENEAGGAVTYAKVPDLDYRTHLMWAFENPDLCRFPISEPVNRGSSPK